jgi:hypothetical protein
MSRIEQQIAEAESLTVKPCDDQMLMPASEGESTLTRRGTGRARVGRVFNAER